MEIGLGVNFGLVIYWMCDFGWGMVVGSVGYFFGE